MFADFTPVSALLGGIMIGIAAVMLLYFVGRIAGISGIIGGLITPQKNEIFWRMCFVFGLLCGGALLMLFHPRALDFEISRPGMLLIIAGLLTGFGTRLGSGCTSGHGVCGLSRLSVRSFVATITFLFAGIITATLLGRFVAS